MLTKECKICGKLFQTYPSRIKRGGGIYCSYRCMGISNKGKIPKMAFKKGHKTWNKGKAFLQKGKNPMWKGGKINVNGYICLLRPEHPSATKSGYIREHRLVMENHIGRVLARHEQVHHINEITEDNRIENLMLFKNPACHRWFHKRGTCPQEGILFDGRKL